MSQIAEQPVAATDANALRAQLEVQRQAALAHPNPDYTQRRQDLLALKQLVSDNQQDIVAAISSDYGNRSMHETLLAEVVIVLDGINHTLQHLQQWMKVQHRAIDISLYPGARNRVIPQPLGVVGIIVPWNFPLQLALSPLTSVLAAGNRAMVKMSENSPALATLLANRCGDYFPPDKLQFFVETGGVGIEFSRLPFDHMLFTGSGQTGRAVMAAAAANLTPVTLELGGKSPAVIAPDFPMRKAAERIVYAKLFNAGQICVTVDYVFVPRQRVEEFVGEARRAALRLCPDIHSADYTSIIDDRSFVRLQQALDDARGKGARLINLSHDQQADPASRKMPLWLALNTGADMQLMQREIFGPVLPVLPYDEAGEVVESINSRDRPLAFYPFTRQAALRDYYLQHVASGGVCVNDALLHVGQHDLPFGGIGASGMGHYHGYEGFTAFSKMRPVFYQARFSALRWLQPPYGKLASQALSFILKIKS